MGITNETFQKSVKQDSFRYLLKNSVSMYESSGSQFFRTTTRIQSGPDAFEEKAGCFETRMFFLCVCSILIFLPFIYNMPPITIFLKIPAYLVMSSSYLNSNPSNIWFQGYI